MIDKEEKIDTNLAQRLKRIGVPAPLMIMQSSGGSIPGSLAATHPVLTLALTALLLVVAAWALIRIYRFLKRVFGGAPAPRPAA